MSNAWNSVKIREFEHLTVGPDAALLRVSGRGSRRRTGSTMRPTLLADDGQALHRFPALPSPPDARDVMRVAYSVAALKITPDTAFSLEFADGTTLPLPAPTNGAARYRPAASAPPASTPAAVLEAEPEVAILQERLDAAQADAAQLRERAALAEAANVQTSATLAELDTWREELERRLASTTTELNAAKSAREGGEQEHRRLRGALPESEAALQLAHAEIRDLTQRVETLAAERHDLARRAEQLVALLAPTETLADLAHDLGHARVQAESLRTAASGAPPEDAPPLDDETLARLSLAAEARAREQAERELLQALAEGQQPLG